MIKRNIWSKQVERSGGCTKKHNVVKQECYYISGDSLAGKNEAGVCGIRKLEN